MMPSIVEMVEIMQRLESKALHVEPRRCVMVRNRNAACRRCAQACPSGAISLHDNVIEIDNELCFECGSCSTVCPSEAIISLKPVDEDLMARVTAQREACPGKAVVICARLAAKHRASADKVVEVPCVGRVDASLLVRMAALGAQDIYVVDGHCKTCRYRDAQPAADRSIEAANALFEAWGVPVRARRTEELPEEVLASSAQEARGGVSRRGFFTDLRSSARSLAVEATQAAIDVEFNQGKKESLRDILKMDASGHMPQSTPERHMRIIDDMASLAVPPEGAVVSGPLFSRAVIDEQKCNNCGLCATFCPTGALRRVEEEPEGVDETGKKTVVSAARAKANLRHWVESRPWRCVGCEMCADVCLKHAVTVVHELPCAALTEREPEVFEGQLTQSKSMFGANASRR